MAREIKFRALEKPSDMVLSMGYIPQFVYGTGVFEDGINTWLVSHEKGYPLASGVFGGVLSGCSHGKSHIVSPDTIGQFTGLKDKNGKEIYEGDIVKFTSRSGLKAAFSGRVIWPEDYAGFCVTANNGGFLDAIKWLHDIEVIGNIYESPELLKV